MSSACRRQREAFRACYEQEVGFVYNLLRRLGVPPADVEDLTQEAFAAVFSNLDRYDESRPMRAWVAGFATRIAAGHRRSQGRRLAREHEAARPWREATEMTSGVHTVEAHVVVARGLDGLDDASREVLVLHDLYGFNMPEVAQMLEVPVNTGYTRLRTARLRFREVLSRDPSRAAGGQR